MPPSTGEMDCTGFGIAILTLFYVSGHVNGLTVTMNGNAVSGQPVTLLMTPTDGSITGAVVLRKPDSTIAGQCGAPVAGSALCSTDFSQNFTTGLTTFSITTLSRVTDEGVWTASHGSEEGTINIKVLTVPTAINATSLVVPPFTLFPGVDSVQDFVVTVPCAYPIASLTWVFIPVSGGTTASAQSSPAASCTSTGNTGCSDTDANSYTCTVRPQYNADVAGQKVYMFATLTLAGEYQSTGINLTITETEITMAESTCTSAEKGISIAALGIACFDVAAIIGCVLLLVLKYNDTWEAHKTIWLICGGVMGGAAGVSVILGGVGIDVCTPMETDAFGIAGLVIVLLDIVAEAVIGILFWQGKAPFDKGTAALPRKPSGPVIVTNVSNTSILLEWKAPENVEGSKINGYKVHQYDMDKRVWEPVQLKGLLTQTSLTVEHLDEGHRYKFRIIAVSDNGNSKPLETKEVTALKPVEK